MAEYKPYTHEGSQGYYDSASGEFLPVDAGWKPYIHENVNGLYNSQSGEFFPAMVKKPDTGIKGFAKDAAKQVPLAAMGAAEALNTGMAGITEPVEKSLSYAEGKLADALGLSAEQENAMPSVAEAFRRPRKEFEQGGEYWAKKQAEMGGNTDPVTRFAGQLVGGAVPGALAWTAGKPFAAMEGAVSASERGENPIVGAVKGAAERGVMGGIFHSLSPFSRPIRMAGMGGTMGVEAAANDKPIVPAIGTGLVLGAVGGPGKVKASEADLDFWKSVSPDLKRYKNKDLMSWELQRGISKADIAEAKREYGIAKEAENINLALDKSRQEPGALLAPKTQVQIEAAIKKGDFAEVDSLRHVVEFEMEQNLKGIIQRNMQEQGESFTPEEKIAMTKLAMGQERPFPTIESKKTLPIEEKPAEISAFPYSEPGTPYTLEGWKAQQPAPPRGEFDFLKGNQSTFLKDLPAGETRNASPQEVRKSGVMRKIWEGLTNFIEPGSQLKSRNDWLIARGKARGLGIDKTADFVDLLNKRFKGEVKSDMTAVFDSINGDIPYNSLSQHQKYLSNRFRTIDDVIGRALVEEGLISKDTYYRMQGKHVRFLHDIYNYEPGIRGAKINSSAYKTRKNLSDQERLARGWTKDPLKSISMSVLEGKKNVEMSKYFTKLLNNNEIVYQDSLVKVGGRKMGIDSAREELALYNELNSREMTPEMAARKGEIQAAIRNNEALNAKPSGDFLQLKGKRYGDLNGAFIHKDVYHDIVPILDFSQKTAHTTLDMMREWSIIANSLWKTKTIALNAPTIMRNLIFSNPIQMNMSGVPLQKVPVYFGKAVKSLITKDYNYTQLRNRGAFATNWTMGDIADLKEMIASTGKYNHPMEKFINLMTWSGKLYGKVDDVWKLAKFIEQTEKGVSPDNSFLEAQKWVMDYSLMDKTIRAARAYPLGAPFIVYQYKILPLLLEAMKDRPWVFAKYALIPALMQAYAMKDMTPEQAAEFERNLPENARNGQSIMLPIKEKDDNGRDIYQSLNGTPLTPWGNWQTMMTHAIQGEPMEAFKTTGALSGLAPQVLIGLAMNRDPYTGREVVNPFEAGDPKLSMLARLDWMNKIMSPGMMTDFGAAGSIADWLEFAKNKRGMPLSWYNAVPRLGGVNINPVDPRAAKTEFAGKAKQVGKSFMGELIKAKQQGNEEGAFGGMLPGKEYMKQSFREQMEQLRNEYKGE